MIQKTEYISNVYEVPRGKTVKFYRDQKVRVLHAPVRVNQLLRSGVGAGTGLGETGSQQIGFSRTKSGMALQMGRSRSA